MRTTPVVGNTVHFFDEVGGDPMAAVVIKARVGVDKAGVNLDVVDPDTGAHSVWINVQTGDDTTVLPHYRTLPPTCERGGFVAELKSTPADCDRLSGGIQLAAGTSGEIVWDGNCGRATWQTEPSHHG